MAHLNLASLLLMGVTVVSVQSRLFNTHESRQFNAGQDVYYAGNSGGTYGSSYDHKECAKPDSNARNNAGIRCATSGCRVKCDRGHKMDGSRSLHLDCDSATGQLLYHDQPWESALPQCLPECSGGCPEGSTCVSPNKCSDVVTQCPPGFGGEQCQELHCDDLTCQNGGTCLFESFCNCMEGYSGYACEEHRCAIPNQLLSHATIGADSELTTLNVECMRGFKMKDGSVFTKFKCQHHQWVAEDGISTFDDVKPNCYG